MPEPRFATIMFKANIHITLRASILDPQGKAVHHALENLGYDAVERVRMGKFVEIWIDAADEKAAEQVAREACQRLLANQVMEDFSIAVERVEQAVAS